MPELAEQRPYHHGDLRSELLRAAERRLQTHGADQLSLRDLAREVGVSHAAPRRHFADRRALLSALAESGFLRLGAALRAAVAEAGDGSDLAARLRAAVTAYARFATENAALNDLMNSSKHHPGAPSVTEAAAAAFGQIIELMEEGQAQGMLAEGDCEDVGLILYATALGITAMVNSGLVGPERLDGLVQDAVSQFLRGAAPVRHGEDHAAADTSD
ncbi:TetR family transcriptional regulator [Streptomyces ruber]|uniref:TetR family transcriptional regulator n=2 Tax=Streptomyces TaxID=1883 RepID=A0A918BF26_9ACTN|nr:TetR/AcrR family transcriptional regulator [Streptomyces ruber]GGQ62341.1 TetR family transcriptional regulator [Streptomyces ruber]